MGLRLTTMVTSPPDRNRLVVEIWNGDVQWAELSRSGEGMLLEVYAQPSGGPQLVPLAEVQRALDEAAAELARHEAEDRGSP
jgi:hypothetical protein